MAGRAFFQIDIEGESSPYEIIGSFSGGATNPKTREVPDVKVGGTMREEPTGGEIREDVELTFIEREDEGFMLDDLHVKMCEWRDEQDSTKRRKLLGIAMFRDKKFQKLLGRYEIQGAWPKIVSSMEMDRSSDDPRQFTVTLTHIFSYYKPAQS